MDATFHLNRLRSMVHLQRFLDEESTLVDKAVAMPYKSRKVSERTKYSDSLWGKMLLSANLSNPLHNDAKKFRRRFRIPYPVFQTLLQQIEAEKCFPKSQ
jgi:hypothetical protein